VTAPERGARGHAPKSIFHLILKKIAIQMAPQYGGTVPHPALSHPGVLNLRYLHE
jgi:hypothetical protein